MTSITGFERNDYAVNGFDQKVKVIDVSRVEIVFEWVDENKVEVLEEDEFARLFRKLKDGKKEEMSAINDSSKIAEDFFSRVMKSEN